MKRILCYGDSNTWGLIPGTGERYPRGVRWTGVLQEMLREKGVTLIEEGLCGRTTVFDDPVRENRNGAAALPGILEKHGYPDGAVIMLGTNDCKPCYRAGAPMIARGMGKCVGILAQGIPAERILVISPPPLRPGVWEDGFDPAFDRASAAKSCLLYGEYARMAAAARVKLLDAGFAQVSDTDREHLTPAGHAALAEAVYRAFLRNF